MTVSIEKEPFTEALFAQMLPLARKCWHESTEAKGTSCAFYGERDFEIMPNLEKFLELHKAGAMLVITVRDGGTLVGYVEGFTYRSLHHKDILGGIGDVMYLEPPYRTYAAVLVARFEEEMTALGAAIIGWPTTAHGPVYRILEARGFVGDDIVMEKRLNKDTSCALPPP